MTEWIKRSCVLGIAVGSIVAIFVWTSDHPAGFPMRCGTDFVLPWQGTTKALTIGTMRLQRPQMQLEFPQDVAELPAGDLANELRVVWRPGEQPLLATPYDPEV